MKHLRLLLSLLSIQGGFACFRSEYRQYQYGAPTQTFARAPVPAHQFGVPSQQFAGGPQAVAPGFRVAAAGPGPNQPISAQGSSINSLLGRQVSLTEFGADGYNAEGGGPVNSGQALTCNFDSRPCCWANVPPPDDQLDWQVATGSPEPSVFPTAPKPQGSYLVAFARGAAPSDEAQFASCSIRCSSSPITIRAKHWQSENVLLQVCLRESFPTNADHNPLLNCQEFPLVQGLATTEVVLPKTSLVDIVFVASNFVGEHGDMAILDDIEVSYDHAGNDCQNQEESDEVEVDQNIKEASHKQTIETSNQETASLGEERFESLTKRERLDQLQGNEGKLVAGKDKFGASGFQGGKSAFGSSGSDNFGSNGVSKEILEETVVESVKTHKTHGQPIVKGAKTTKFSESVCQTTKCDFEKGDICNYKDSHTSQSIRGLTTKFQVAEGQFMNRVTGVKESSEGDYYAATFLFPREMAGLEASTEPFTEETRLRFRYYEGTHGVQLKACCGTIDSCPFSSDKFVTVSDRLWKTASFKCPAGTDKVIFLCENTRTNQGACAVDDIGVVETDGPISKVKPLC